MKRTSVIGFVTIVMLAALALVAAAGPVASAPAVMPDSPSATLFSYQGQVSDAAGSPITNPALPMTFKLYKVVTGGTPCWTEAHTGSNAVNVLNGLFHVLLGQITAIPASCLTGDAYLELVVNVETLSPRELLTSVAYAVEAGQAQTVPDGSITNPKLALLGGLGLGGDGSTSATYSGAYGNLTLRNYTGSIRTIADSSLYFFLDANNDSTDAAFRLLRDNSSLTSPMVDVFKIVENGDATVYGNLAMRGSLHVNSDSDPTSAQIGFNNDDFVTYDDTVAPGAFSLDADGGTGNALLVAGGAYLGTAYDSSYRLKTVGDVSLEDHELHNVRALQLKDWDDDTGGADDTSYRLLARDGAWQFYDGGVVIGDYANDTWGDLADGNLIVESKVGIGTTTPSEKLDVSGNIKVSNDLTVGHYLQVQGYDLTMGPNDRGDEGRALTHMNDDVLVINFMGDFAGGVRMDSNLNLNGHSVSNCGALVEANLQTHEESAADRIDRFQEGDVLCWGVDQLESCSVANDRLVQAVADSAGKPIVLGAEKVKVLGPVQRGDILVASDVPGYAMVNNEPRSGSVIAQALESFDGKRGAIKAMIRKW